MNSDSRNSRPVIHVSAKLSTWSFQSLFAIPLSELVRYRELTRNIVARDLKIRYKRSVLGILWTVAAPLMQMLVMWVVFTKIFHVRTENYAVYLFTGIIAWNVFVQSSSAGAASILGSIGLVSKVKLPRVIFPLSSVVNNLVNFCFSFIALLVVMLVSGAPIHWTIVLTPVVMIPLVLFSMGWAMLISSLVVFFRDLQYITDIALQALFYATPIMWDPQMVSPNHHWLLTVNPFAKFIHLFRQVVYVGNVPELQVYLVALGIGIVMFFVGWVSFQQLQRKFVYWF